MAARSGEKVEGSEPTPWPRVREEGGGWDFYLGAIGEDREAMALAGFVGLEGEADDTQACELSVLCCGSDEGTQQCPKREEQG